MDKKYIVLIFAYFALIVGVFIGGMTLVDKHIIGDGLFAVITVFVFLLPFIVMWKPLFGISKDDKKILETGVEALAEILQVKETGVTVNQTNYKVNLTLKVKPTFSAPFEVKASQLFQRLQLPNVGDVLKVKYDPKNLTKVVILTEADVADTDDEASIDKAMAILLELDKNNKMVLSYGIEAQAKILKAEDMNIDVDGDSILMSFEIEVMPEGKPKFTAKAKAPILKVSFEKFKPGHIVTVKYDPNDLTKVTMFHS